MPHQYMSFTDRIKLFQQEQLTLFPFDSALKAEILSMMNKKIEHGYNEITLSMAANNFIEKSNVLFCVERLRISGTITLTSTPLLTLPRTLCSAPRTQSHMKQTQSLPSRIYDLAQRQVNT